MRFTGWLGAVLLTVSLPVAARAETPTVAPGYDLFTTLSGTRIGVDVDGPGPAGETLMSFASEPLGSWDFGSGPRDVGAADTIVRRFEAATPSDGLVPVGLQALQLRSVEPVGYYATLQDDRGRHPLDPPDALASPGLIDIRFDPGGLGGTFHVEFLVNYDIRQGSPAGPIVAMGSTRIQGDDRWQSAAAAGPQVACHTAGGPVPLHQHCVVSVPGDAVVMACGEAVAPIPRIEGVNHLLNGEDQSSDFNPGHATSSAECGNGSGETCGLQARNQPAGSPNDFSGAVRGGPFFSGDPNAQVTLGCAVQLNSPTHAGPDLRTASGTGPGSAAAFAAVDFQMSPQDTAYVCTQVRFGAGPVWYYDAATGEFSTSATVTCASAPVPRAVAPGPGAVPGACNGTGSVQLGAGVATFPNTSVNVPFGFTFDCQGGGSVTGSGVLATASCGRLQGSGAASGIGTFSVEGIGLQWVFTGAVSGSWKAVPIPDSSAVPPQNTCGNGTARVFATGGSLVF